MAVGDLSFWKAHFRSYDSRFIAKIIQHWPSCVQVLTSSAEEDDITNNLVHRLCKDSEVRDIGWPEAQYVPLDEIQYSSVVKAKGFIDIALIINGNRDDYIAYECKRLNVVYSTGRQSLATQYVNDGLKRFVYQQYSSTLPVACMIGYIMDGDLSFAKKSINVAITTHLSGSELISQPKDIDAMGASARFQTEHTRKDGSPIEILHSFLSF